MTFFAPDWALLGTFSVPLPSGAIAESNAVAHLANGEIVVETRVRFMFGYEGESAMLRQPGGLFRVDPTDESADSIGVTAGNEVFMHLNSGGGTFAGIPLFGRDAFVTTHAGRILLGDAVDMQVEEWRQTACRLASFASRISAGAVRGRI